MSLTVIIPSRSVDNLTRCVEAIHDRDGGNRLIVIDDGLTLDPWPEILDGSTLIEGAKPFIFARNVNRGIQLAGADDVVVLNDDALLQTPGGFTAMRQAADEHPEFGVIAATTNVGGPPSQQPRGIGLREEARTLAFVCVLIPRRTVESVGLMDEQFGGFTPDGRRIYGWCDNDYCRRVRSAGLKLGVLDGVFVDHASLRSEFRGDPGAGGDISAGRELYVQKWGDEA